MSSARIFFYKDTSNFLTEGVLGDAGKFFCSKQLVFGELLICCLLIVCQLQLFADLELDTLSSLSAANSKYTSRPSQSDVFNLSIT